MSSPDETDRIRDAESEWRERTASQPVRDGLFSTPSNIPVEPVYTPRHQENSDYLSDVGLPGDFPICARGAWQLATGGGCGPCACLLAMALPRRPTAASSTFWRTVRLALSVAFDMATLYGYDTDDAEAEGEFGKCGVAVSSLADMEILFDGIPLDQVTTSMTINAPAAIIWAMYIAAAEKQGVSQEKLGGTLQNDILKEYIAQNEYIFPPEPSMRLVVDTVEYATAHLPRWNPISISGYHIREAGSTAVQELAFTLGDGFEYVRWCVERGLKVDDFAPRLSFFFNVCNDFFEEIAKFRAARKVWATEMRETFGAQDPRSWWLRTHAQTSGAALTAQQPENNTVRVGLQALAAVLGGTQSLHTNSADEAWALPSEKAALTALRTQQIIAHETGVTDTVDPLGGSYFLESLTQQLAGRGLRLLPPSRGCGRHSEGPRVRGSCSERLRWQHTNTSRSWTANRRIVVGVNDYTAGDTLGNPHTGDGPRRRGPSGPTPQRGSAHQGQPRRQAASCGLGSRGTTPAEPHAPHLGRGTRVRHPRRGDGCFPAGVRGISSLLGHMREGLLLENTGDQRRRHQLPRPLGRGGGGAPLRRDFRGSPRPGAKRCWSLAHLTCPQFAPQRLTLR